MVLNIQFQVAGLVLLIIIMIMYAKQRVLNLINEQYFVRLMTAVFICMFLDISSVFAINLRQYGDGLWCEFICKSYLASIIAVAYAFLLYTIMPLKAKNKNKVKNIILQAIPFASLIVLMMVTRIYYNEGDNYVYTSGLCVNYTYLVAVFYLIEVMFYLTKYYKSIPLYKRYSILFLASSWLFTAILQFINRKWLLVGYSMCVAIAYMYMKIENPESNIDKETGAFNKNALLNYTSGVMMHGEGKLYVLVISVDDFRFITETFGYRNTNQLLRDIVSFLARNKDCKVFKRSENQITLTYDNAQALENHIKEIEKRFENTWNITEVSLKVFIKMCYVDASKIVAQDNLTELINYYIVKCGKDGYGNIIKIDEEKLHEKEIMTEAENSVKLAIEQEGVEVYYQPIFSIEKNRFISAEALVRIKDKNGKFISPELFIPIAEQNGKIVELGMIVFRKVCKMIKESQPEKYGIEYLEVNLSVVQCMQENLADELITIMQEYNIEPSFINLEITETAAVKSEKTLLANMKKLIEAGITFTIDDYGTGYSNVNYVIGLPISIVKIDKQLVWSYFKSDKAKVAMEFAILMLHNMNMKIVAEGIEEEYQLEKMRELGVDDIQGYYYSKPLPQNEFLERIKS